MSKVTIRDFLLKLGFDSKDVDKGLKRVDGEVMKLNKKIQNQATALNRINNKNSKAQDKKLRDMRTENNLLKKKKQLIDSAAKSKTTYKSPLNSGGMSDEQLQMRRARQATSLSEQRKNLQYNANGIGSGRDPAQMAASLDKVNKKLRDFRGQLKFLESQSATAKTKQEFANIQIQMQKVRGETNRLLRSKRQLTNEMRKQAFVANALKDSMRNLARSYVSVFAVMGGVGMAGNSGQGMIQARTSLLAAAGSAEEAGKQFEFVKEVAMKFGVGLQGAIKGYSKVGVAARTAGMSVAQTKDLFLAATEASTAFGLSSEETTGIFKAFSDMLSKGTLSAEELKGQLG